MGIPDQKFHGKSPTNLSCSEAIQSKRTMKRNSEAIIDLTEEPDSGNELETKKKKVKTFDKSEEKDKKKLKRTNVDLTVDEEEENLEEIRAAFECKHCDHR